MDIYADIQYWKEGKQVPEKMGSELHRVKKIEFCCIEMSEAFAQQRIRFTNSEPIEVRVAGFRSMDRDWQIECCPFCGARIVKHPTSSERLEQYKKDNPGFAAKLKEQHK